MERVLHVEVVNLRVSKERRDRMQQAFGLAGVRPEFHPAVYFKEHDPEDLEEECLSRGPWGPIPPGHQAATISHARVWERFLNGKKTFCAVFEDDVFVSPELGDWFSDMSWWPPDADVVKLEKWRSARQKVLLDNDHVLWKGRRISRMRTRHMGAAGYILSRAAAARLLASKPYAFVIDHLLFNLNASRIAGQMTIYQVDPALVAQGNEDAGSSRMQQTPRVPLRSRLRQELRRAVLEVAYPVRTYARWLGGKACLKVVDFR